MIDPASLAFDIDGVFADTMNLFLDIARDEFNINWIRYEYITSYNLEECLDIDKKIIDAILDGIVDGSYHAPLKSIDGAPEVLTRIGKTHCPVLFVTARTKTEAICKWIQNILPIDPASIEIISTTSFENKAEVLLEKGINYFVEDRLETCCLLKNAGVEPVLFKQPWNMKSHPFIEVSTWKDLESLITFDDDEI